MRRVTPVSLAVIVLAFSGCLAGLAPFSGVAGFVRNLLVCAAVLVGLMAIGAVAGTVLRDFLIEMN